MHIYDGNNRYAAVWSILDYRGLCDGRM